MIVSGAVNVVPGADVVVKIDPEEEQIIVEVNGEVVYDSED